MRGIDIMETMIGWNEVDQRQAIIDFLTKYNHQGDIIVDPKTTPWCAAIWNGCERAAGNPGTGMVNARSGLMYGTPIKLEDAEEGDTCIFKRGGSSWQGHITYFSKQLDANRIVCLGGNQSDSVCYSVYPTAMLLGIRRY